MLRVDKGVVAFGVVWALLGVFQILYLDPIDYHAGFSWSFIGTLFVVLGFVVFLLGTFSPSKKEVDRNMNAKSESSLSRKVGFPCALLGLALLFWGLEAYNYVGYLFDLAIQLIALGVVLIIVGAFSYFHVRTK